MNTQAKTSIFLLVALSSTHLFNDMLQAIISAVYPLIKSDLSISFAQIGAITLSYQISASIFQPIMGFLSDKRPNAYFLPLALIFTFCGLTTLAYADSFHAILISVSVVGIGSSILHPEAARLTSMASGGRRRHPLPSCRLRQPPHQPSASPPRRSSPARQSARRDPPP